MNNVVLILAIIFGWVLGCVTVSMIITGGMIWINIKDYIREKRLKKKLEKHASGFFNVKKGSYKI
jgi:hypothetical protein